MITDAGMWGTNSYWRYKAKEISREQGEACAHLNTPAFFVNIIYSENHYTKNVGFKVKCVTCGSKFYETRVLLIAKFLKFYEA